jgi:Ca2+/Na+ antiporter
MSLKKSQIGFVVARVVAIYLVIHAIDILASLGRFAMFAGTDPRIGESLISTSVLYLLWILIYLAAAALFYTRADQLSSYFAGESEPDTDEISNVDQKQVERVAFTVIGIYLVATALPHVVTIILSMSQRESPRATSEILSTATSLVVGIFLTLGAKGLQAAINKYREA